MRLRKQFQIAKAGDDVLVVTGQGVKCELHFSHRDAAAAVRALATGSRAPDAAALDATNDPALLAEWLHAIGLLHQAQALEYPVGRDDIVVVPHSGLWKPAKSQSARMSRFASLRFSNEVLLIESPLADAHVELQSAKAIGLVTDPSQEPLREALECAGLLADQDDSAAHWSRADANMHAASRLGPLGNLLGGKDAAPSRTFRPEVSDWISLPHATREDSLDLDEILRSRRSERTYSEIPISKAEVGGLLARSSWEEFRQLPDGKPGIARAYPSGGNAHSLDLYVSVASCSGLPAGLYLYDRQGHRLGLVAGAEVARALVRSARAAAFEDDAGQVLLILASDFDVVMSRYEGIAYSLILKEAGAALQTIHLVATTMNLAACPIGTGNSKLFARALGTTSFRYSSVGEMLVGSNPTPK